MLVDFPQMKNCYLICGYMGLRNGIDGLAAVITSQFPLDILGLTVLFTELPQLDIFQYPEQWETIFHGMLTYIQAKVKPLSKQIALMQLLYEKFTPVRLFVMAPYYFPFTIR